MDDSKYAIRVKGLRKRYRLGQINGTTLRETLQSWWARKRGREDPNRKIWSDGRFIGQTFWALDGIDLTIRQGERLGIIGANGAGKSTFLKLLSRITSPTEGQIELRGRISSLLEVGTGFHGELTGRENVYMNGAILGMSRAQIAARMDEIIEFSEVGEFIDTPVKRYSSGMFVRLAFAVAAHLNSEILIMDEVLAVGDMAFQEKCLSRMRQAADEEGKTILYVSHNMETIRRLCARCIVLDHGKLIYDGDPEEAIRRYMNTGFEQGQVIFDLSEHSTTSKGIDSGLRLTELRIADRDEPRYQAGETVKMEVRLRVSKPLRGAALRIVLRTESDSPLGTSYTAPVDFPKEGNYVVTVLYPLGQLVRGTLFGDVGFYNLGDSHMNILLDNAPRAFRFEVQGPRNWRTSVRGYMRFEDTEVVSVRQEA